MLHLNISYINVGNLPFTEMLRRHDTAGPSYSDPAGHDTAAPSTYEPHTGSYPQSESRHDYSTVHIFNRTVSIARIPLIVQFISSAKSFLIARAIIFAVNCT
jgi:hypothetical protein